MRAKSIERAMLNFATKIVLLLSVAPWLLRRLQVVTRKTPYDFNVAIAGN